MPAPPSPAFLLLRKWICGACPGLLFSGHFRALDVGPAHLGIPSAADEEDLVEATSPPTSPGIFYRRTSPDHAILLPAGANHCVHCETSFKKGALSI